MDNITILVADDHGMIRQGLRSLLAAEPGMEVLAEAEDGRSAVKLAAKLSPDVVVMDINMPDLDGIEATRQVRARAAQDVRTANGDGPSVVALSGHSDPRFAREMLKAGAAGFVLKENAFAELVTAIRAVAAHKVYLSPALATTVARDFSGTGAGGSNGLTEREREVLALMAEGKSTKEIAFALGVSIKTIETHRRKLMMKLDLDSVAQLTKYAVREGISSI